MKSLKDIQALLGVSDFTVRKYCKEGKIPHHRLPTGRVRFTDEDYEKIREMFDASLVLNSEETPNE
jgi:predicted site-specific integrase-resolvase